MALLSPSPEEVGESAMLLLLLSTGSFIMRSWDRPECHNARFKFRDNRLLGSITERETRTESMPFLEQ